MTLNLVILLPPPTPNKRSKGKNVFFCHLLLVISLLFHFLGTVRIALFMPFIFVCLCVCNCICMCVCVIVFICVCVCLSLCVCVCVIPIKRSNLNICHQKIGSTKLLKEFRLFFSLFFPLGKYFCP